MNKSDISFKTIPDTPGVYIFRNAKRSILYIGKATSLRSRVRSYFGKDIAETRGPRIVKMLQEAVKLDWESTDSVLEALILEANLIKKHQPLYNAREKDNKSFNYVVITQEAFPRVLLVRGRELFSSWKQKDMTDVFGPFPSGSTLKEALKIIRKIFPFRDTCNPAESTPCFNRQIGLCPGVCSGEITQTEYRKQIQHIRMLFLGKKKKLLEQLKRTMMQYAKREAFEQATEVRRQLFALTHIGETALLGSDYKVSSGGETERIEAYDIAHMGEKNRVGVMTVVEDGKAHKKDYRKFIIRTEKQGDTAALEEVLKRRFEHIEWRLPGIMVIDGGVAQKNTAQQVLDELGYKIPIINIVKNDRHKAEKIVGNQTLIARWEKDILLANSEAHRFAISFFRKKQRKSLV